MSCKSSSSSSDPPSSQSDISMVSGTLTLTSNYRNGSTSETSEIQSDLSVNDNYSESDKGNPISENDFSSLTEATANEVFSENSTAILSKECGEGKEEKYVQKLFDGRINLDHHDSVEICSGQENLVVNSPAKGLSTESPQDRTSAALKTTYTSYGAHQDNDASSKCSGGVETSAATATLAISDLQFSPDTLVVLPLDEQQKLRRLLANMQQRLITSKTDIEDLITRLNQELAVRQHLTTRVCQ